MNFTNASNSVRSLAFRALRYLAHFLPTTPMESFGDGEGKISRILVINLDRQPRRLRRVTRELKRFRTVEGLFLSEITRRQVAIDARDGRAVAATSDVDPIYRIADQLFVQPDPILEAAFAPDEPIRMTRQEVAVARSHIECWKIIVEGNDEFVLILEDDIWFRPGADAQIDSGWQAAMERFGPQGPDLFYLSYSDAGGTAQRDDVSGTAFRPKRGLWFLSGYILSRSGAAKLLKAMPVTGPVDLWMNYRFKDLGVLALNSPAIEQSPDIVSENLYSVLPYLARAGVVDYGSGPVRPKRPPLGLVIAWSAKDTHDRLAMALSMLGLRVRTFCENEAPLQFERIQKLAGEFDVLVDAPLAKNVLSTLVDLRNVKFVVEANRVFDFGIGADALPPQRTVMVSPNGDSWGDLCALLGVPTPAQDFPKGTPRAWKTFAPEKGGSFRSPPSTNPGKFASDDSPWVLPPLSGWRPRKLRNAQLPKLSLSSKAAETASAGPPFFKVLTETFPGNLANFNEASVVRSPDSTSLIVSRSLRGHRAFESGALASRSTFTHGRFEAEIRAAKGAGLVTGFFLHRHQPRQEIDVELPGNDPTRMLVNVYFNPGDEGATMNFGYRGTPTLVDLGFDATEDFHLYAIEWRPDFISWSVDGNILHERRRWDPTPIPHLAMRLHANLWVPRSVELAGRLDDGTLPSEATFRNVAVWN